MASVTRIIADLAASLGGRSVRVLTYHSISDDQNDPFAISPALFLQQMASLATSGVPVLSASALLAALDARSIQTAVCLTFDDGLEDFATNGLPILRDHGFPSTLFVPTSLVGTVGQWSSWSGYRRFLGWTELGALIDAGVEIGSHARTHRRLSTLASDDIAAELQRSRVALAEHLPVWLDAVAYPYGDHSPLVQGLSRETGYRAGFAVGGLWGNRLGVEQFALRRLVITRGVSPARIRRIVQGLDDWAQAFSYRRRTGVRPNPGPYPPVALSGPPKVIAKNRP